MSTFHYNRQRAEAAQEAVYDGDDVHRALFWQYLMENGAIEIDEYLIDQTPNSVISEYIKTGEGQRVVALWAKELAIDEELNAA